MTSTVFWHIPLPEYDLPSFCNSFITGSHDSCMPGNISQQDQFQWLEKYYSKLSTQITPEQKLKVLITGGGRIGISPQLLRKLCQKICKLPQHQLSIELNPNLLSHDNLLAINSLSFDNLILPIWSFNDQVLKGLNITPWNASALRNLSSFSSLKTNSAVMLIVGTKDQNTTNFKEDLFKLQEAECQEIIAIPCDLYNQTVRPKSPVSSCDSALQLKLLDVFFNFLADNSFHRATIYDYHQEQTKATRLITFKLSQDSSSQATDPLHDQQVNQINYYLKSNLYQGQLNLQDFEQRFKVSLEELLPGLIKNLSRKGLVQSKKECLLFSPKAFYYAHNILPAIKITSKDLTSIIR